MKRKIGMLLMAFCLVIVVACSGGKNEDSSSSSNAQRNQNEQQSTTNKNDSTGNHQAQSDSDEQETVTIKFHTHGTEANYNWSETLAAFEDKYPHIKVDLILLSEKGDSQEATQKLDLAAASGEQLDVLMFTDPASYAQRVSLGMVAPLDEFIAQDDYNVEEDYKVNTLFDGKYYALPGKFNPWYVLLNKDHLNEAGLEVPTDWTWDDFMEYARKLTQGEGAAKRYGTYFHGPQNGGWMEYMKLALASKEEETEFIKADGTSNLDDPMFRRTLEIRYQMEKVDGSSTPYADMLSQKLHYRSQYFNQSASMIVIGSWMNTELGGTDQFPLEFEAAVAPYPKNSLTDGGYAPVTTDYMAVAAKSQHKEEAYTFIRWYTTEGQIIQGKNIPSWNGVADDQLASIIDTILSDTLTPEKVDKASLINTLAGAKSSRLIPPVSYQAEVYKAINDEYEKMILGAQSIDDTLQAMKEKVQEIIENNK